VNERCESDVKNLYACGSAAGGIYGFARIEGFTICITQVFGKRAGRYGAWNAQTDARAKIHQKDVDTVKAELKHLLASRGELSPTHRKSQLREIMSKNAGVLKTEEGLNQAANAIRELRKMPIGLSSSTLRFNYELVDALEFRNMLEVAQAVLMGSLMRKETRGAFIRSDYPSKDDQNWKRHILYRRGSDGRIEATAEGQLLAKAA
jgi:succinate dehydrogenase / fumarate reductase flavoprotein subunit